MIAQLVEHLYVKQETRGSTPGLGQHYSVILLSVRFILEIGINM